MAISGALVHYNIDGVVSVECDEKCDQKDFTLHWLACVSTLCSAVLSLSEPNEYNQDTERNKVLRGTLSSMSGTLGHLLWLNILHLHTENWGVNWFAFWVYWFHTTEDWDQSKQCNFFTMIKNQFYHIRISYSHFDIPLTSWLEVSVQIDANRLWSYSNVSSQRWQTAASVQL